MVNVGNDIVQLSAGEKCPFSCPNCHEFIAFKENIETLKCPTCKYEADVEEFWWALDPVSPN